MFPGKTSAPIRPENMYTAEMIRKACKNFEKFYELNVGEATVEWINKHSMKVADWEQANVDDYDDIHQGKARREADSLIGGCSIASPNGGLYPLIEKTSQGLNALSPSEWVLIDVIADSGACETVMPKGLCPNIALRESEASKAGVEYEVANCKAVPNLEERHCEIFCRSQHP